MPESSGEWKEARTSKDQRGDQSSLSCFPSSVAWQRTTVIVSRFWIWFLPLGDMGTRGCGIFWWSEHLEHLLCFWWSWKDYLVGHLSCHLLEFTDLLFCSENCSSFRHLKVVNLSEGRNCKMQHIMIKQKNKEKEGVQKRWMFKVGKSIWFLILHCFSALMYSSYRTCSSWCASSSESS